MSRRKKVYYGELICPICCTWYSAAYFGLKPGDLCGDLSLGQKEPCVGRLMPEEDFHKAEWRTPYDREDGTPMRRVA